MQGRSYLRRTPPARLHPSRRPRASWTSPTVVPWWRGCTSWAQPWPTTARPGWGRGKLVPQTWAAGGWSGRQGWTSAGRRQEPGEDHRLSPAAVRCRVGWLLGSGCAEARRSQGQVRAHVLVPALVPALVPGPEQGQVWASTWAVQTPLVPASAAHVLVAHVLAVHVLVVHVLAADVAAAAPGEAPGLGRRTGAAPCQGVGSRQPTPVVPAAASRETWVVHGQQACSSAHHAGGPCDGRDARTGVRGLPAEARRPTAGAASVAVLARPYPGAALRWWTAGRIHAAVHVLQDGSWRAPAAAAEAGVRSRRSHQVQTVGLAQARGIPDPEVAATP